ncbi:DUF3800 domain-containing protein [Granulicella aggregans]|uniref:DUF3800 domain-containing protein n=1 Tax=Granulicella aggregans TaxID=474949 RepID=UPI0021E084AC|nr:DUF3800 domain-containing protein [Granulicella aggregans]
MFTFYIDDSGTAPDSKVAIAAGVVIPAIRLQRFEEEWTRFLEKYKITNFHTSECLARNSKSEFSAWSDEDVQRAFDRVQQITFKYAIKGFCIAINKELQEQYVPPHMWAGVGKSPLMWALGSLLGLSYDFAFSRSVPMEYIFDSTEDKQLKRDIIEAIEYSEERGYGKHFLDHYTFRSRIHSPGLQIADFYAWHGFHLARQHHYHTPSQDLALKTIGGFALRSAGVPDVAWSTMQTLDKGSLQEWVKKLRDSEAAYSAMAYKAKRKAERMPERKKPKHA